MMWECREGGRPKRRRPPHLPRPGFMYEALRLEQRQSWQRGEPVPLESYVQRFPELTSHPDALAALVEGEVSLREARGESPRLEEYLHRFPQCAELLIRQFSSRGQGLETRVSSAESVISSAEAEGTHSGQRYETIISEPQGNLATATVALHARWPEIAGYTIDGELGRGGMGVVYRARQLSADRLVALK